MCLAFVPYRSDDYEYMRWISDDRRRESFALARDRCTTISGSLPTDGAPWDFEGLKGSYPPPHALILMRAAFYVSYLICSCTLDLSGLGLRDEHAMKLCTSSFNALRTASASLNCEALHTASASLIFLPRLNGPISCGFVRRKEDWQLLCASSLNQQANAPKAINSYLTVFLIVSIPELLFLS